LLVDVRGPKGPGLEWAERTVPWARGQLAIAADILDNPGGGLVFATQTIGQVKAAFQERDPDQYREQIALLEQAEDAAVRRDYPRSRGLLQETLSKLTG
jgi:hypothetical protein